MPDTDPEPTMLSRSTSFLIRAVGTLITLIIGLEIITCGGTPL